MKEDGLLASVLLFVGLLRLAAASRSEPWSGDSANESFLEESLVTSKSHLISVGEDHTGEVTLQFDSWTSDPANEDITHLYGITGVEAQSTPKEEDGGLVLTIPTGEAESPEPTVTDGGLLRHQTDALVTNKTPIIPDVLTSQSIKTKQNHLATSLFSKERLSNATTQELRPSEEWSTSPSGKTEEMESPAGSLESTGQWTVLSTVLSLMTANSRSIPTLASGKSGTEPEGQFLETILTPRRRGMGKSVTAIPEANQQSQVMSQQTTLVSRTSDVTRSPGTPMMVQNISIKSSSTFQEQDGVTIPRTKMEQHDSYLDSSTPGKMTRDKTTELTVTETPMLQTSPQSKTWPFLLLSTSETLSSASLEKSSRKDNISQSFQSKSFFPSQFPLSRTSDVSSKAEEHLHEGMNAVLLDTVDYQTTTQTPLFNLSQTAVRESSPLANLHKITNEDQPSTMAYSVPQPSSVPPSVYDRSQVSIASTFSLAGSTSSHGRNTMSSFGTSSHVNSPSTSMSVPSRHSTQGMFTFQQLYMLSTVHGEQTSAASVIDPETLFTSSAPVPTTLQEPDIHITVGRSDLLPLPRTEPQYDSDPTDIAAALTKTTVPSNLASPHVGLNSSVAASSTHSTSRVLLLSTLANGEQGGEVTTTIMPSQVNEQTLSNTASFHTRPASSHVELGVSRTPSVAGLEISSPSFLDRTKTKLPPSVSISFYAETPLLPGQVLTNSQPLNINPLVYNEHPLSTLSTMVPSHTSSQAPGNSVTIVDDSHLLVTSTPAHAITETNGTAAEGGLPGDAEQHTTDIFTTSKARSSPSIFMEHALLRASAHPGVQALTHNETQTSSPSFSAPLQFDSFNTILRDSLKQHTSHTSAFVHTKSQSSAASTTAYIGDQIPSLSTTMPPHLQPQTTPVLLVTPYTFGEIREGKSSSQTSPPTSPAGIYRTSLPSVSTSDSLRTSPSGFPTPAPQISHHNTTNFSHLSSVHIEDNGALSTMSTLTISGAQDLPQSFLGLPQYLNWSSGELGASSLNSFVANSILGTSPSLQYMSLLVRSAENMVCLQRMPNSSPLSEEPNTDGHRVASAQEALPLSSAFGLPHLGASSLIQMSPSSVILVKPLFVFLPAETSKIPAPSFMEEEWKHKTNLSFPHQAVLGLSPYTTNQEQHMRTSPTMSTTQHFKLLSSHAFSMDKQNISETFFSALPKSTEVNPTKPDSSTSNPFTQPSKEASTRTKFLGTPNWNSRIQSSSLVSQKVGRNQTIAISVGTTADHHHISGASTVMLPILERPKTFPPSAELLNISVKTSSLPSLVEPSASQMLRSSFQTSRALNIPQLSTTRMFHTEGRQQDPLTPIALVSKNFEESLNASSARNMKLPLEVGHFTPASLTSRRSLSTELIGKELLLAPSEVQYVPNEVSSYQLLPVGKEHDVSASSNDSYSEAVGAFPVSTASSYHTSTIFSKLFNFHRISPKSIMGKENPISLLSPSALFPVGSPASSTPSEEPLETLMNHQGLSGLSTNKPSQVSSSHSYFAKSMMKYNPTTRQMVGKRALFSSTQGWPKPRVSTGETNLSARDHDARHQVEAIHIVPVSSGTEARNLSVWLATTDFKPTSVPPDDTVRSVGLQGLFQNLPPRTVLADASISHRQGTTVLPSGGGTSVMAASQSVWNRLMQPSVSEANIAGFSSTSLRQGQHLEHKKRGTVRTTNEFLVRSSSQPAQASLEGEHLGDKWIQDVVSSFSTPSPVFSTFLNGPKRSTLSFGIEEHDDRGLLRQRSYWQNSQLHISESFPSLQTEVQPNPGSFEPSYNIQTDGDVLVNTASSTGATSELRSYTSEEQVVLTRDPTGEGDGDDGEINEDNDDDEHDGSVSDLSPWDSSTGLLDWRAQHHRRRMRSDDVFLNGLAIVSDDVCNSGNYTTEMRLQPASRGKTLYPPGSFLAQVFLHDNGSRPTLSVKSCCVTPTARPTGPEAASCCHFPRSLLGCKHVQVHQNSKSGIASFAIQLFRMLNHSVAYLHCELSVCLTELAGCQENCLEIQEQPSKPSNRRSYETFRNVISFGPVLRTEAEFPLGSTPSSPLSMMFLAFLLSLTSTIGVMGAIVVLWVCWRGQVQKGDPLGPLAGNESP